MSYNIFSDDVWPKSDQQMTNRDDLHEEKEGERESNVSPIPLSYKEKEKEREESEEEKNARAREKAIEELIVGSSGAGQI